MKHSNLLALLAVATLASAAGVNTTVQAQTIKPVKSVTQKVTSTYSFPKKWRGKWYSSNILTPKPLIIKLGSYTSPKTGQTVKMTSVASAPTTGKLTSEITSVSQDQDSAKLAALATGSSKKINHITWSLVTPTSKDAESAAYSMKVEKLDGKKVQVLFEAQPDTGKVYNQYFKSKKLAKKYGNHHFKKISYTEYNYR
ncbi:hypothetical protein OZY43_06680 [Lactobacillus sp. ESL0785]|uniref:hypothetical protein n=1 Tax=Lactobacillus sp. ESL0785 TaxID=2983232 RepID=UPI0023F6DCDE|nr:hypothetical protein [Lactobacillus sp. ESL0785]WEV70618.1 hypothetical protein OZY43_06680 [Lactobacillus sp. ESL0785]